MNEMSACFFHLNKQGTVKERMHRDRVIGVKVKEKEYQELTQDTIEM